jgi:hypothetical protein
VWYVADGVSQCNAMSKCNVMQRKLNLFKVLRCKIQDCKEIEIRSDYQIQPDKSIYITSQQQQQQQQQQTISVVR